MLRSFFSPDRPIHEARAPGRLDVMGGIADYSGSLVLQLPIAEAAFATVQQDDGGVIVSSASESENDRPRQFTIEASDWAALQRAEFEDARGILTRVANDAWVAYVLGPVLVLLREAGRRLDGGLRIRVSSYVPEGKGVSSSAAVEVATMRAVAALLDQDVSGEQLARWCQIAENHIVGAPCGIMDQMTAALGRENELLALRCQTAVVEGFVPVPAGMSFWGIDSGIRHAVSGADYTSVRCGAFMGYRMIAEAAGCDAKPASDAAGVMEVDDRQWGGYLANITPVEFRERFAAILPEQMTGAEFLDRYGGTTDRVTRVDPARTYAVRQPTRHPIEENERVAQFRSLLQGKITEQSLRAMGALMAAAHASYSACGIGSDGTDLLVRLVYEAGPGSGLCGAKITGGGSGGTVAIVGRAGADAAVEDVAREYTRRTGRATHIFRGSSPGACATEVKQVTIDAT